MWKFKNAMRLKLKDFTFDKTSIQLKNLQEENKSYKCFFVERKKNYDSLPYSPFVHHEKTISSILLIEDESRIDSKIFNQKINEVIDLMDCIKNFPKIKRDYSNLFIKTITRMNLELYKTNNEKEIKTQSRMDLSNLYYLLLNHENYMQFFTTPEIKKENSHLNIKYLLKIKLSSIILNNLREVNIVYPRKINCNSCPEKKQYCRVCWGFGSKRNLLEFSVVECQNCNGTGYVQVRKDCK